MNEGEKGSVLRRVTACMIFSDSGSSSHALYIRGS